MADNIIISLNLMELQLAAELGIERQLESLRKKLSDKHGFNGLDKWTIHIEGAAGEMALAKYLNVFFVPTINTFKKGGDVGNYQVRTCLKNDEEDLYLLVRPDDDDERIFIAIWSRCPDYHILGWMKSSDAKQEKWKQFRGGRPPAFFVKPEFLNPMSTLPKI